MEIPQPDSLVTKIDQWHQRHQEKPRPHLGASMLGHPCERWLWLSFRWAVVEQFDGRILRLFRRGHNEELTIVSDLRNAGITITDTGAKQSRVDFGSHVSGSIDGVITSGVPEAPEKKHIAEFKTHSKKSFDELLKKGVQESKPVHYAQMQVYMYGKGIDRALYVAVCKDDDRLYTERVKLSKTEAKKLIAKGHRITLSDRMPEPLSADPTWYQCKFCPAHSFCHETKLTKKVNCRTCAHSTPTEESEWNCSRYPGKPIPTDFQHKGCCQHVLHPDLVPWPMSDSDKEHCAVYEIDGVPVYNGCANIEANIFGSKELVSHPEECAKTAKGEQDEFIQALRETFDAEFTNE